MAGLWRRLLGLGHRSPAVELTDADWQALIDRLPWVTGLTDSAQTRLRQQVGRFLADKTITPTAGLHLDSEQRRIIAALCCLPVVEYGYHGLHGWSEVIVHPDTFRAHRSHFDEPTGVVTEGEEELAGEVWEHGPVVLSWGDIEADLAEPEAGFLVAVHEIAHKLDLLDGVFDGTPPLPADWHRSWVADFQSAFDALVAQVAAGHDTAIDPYAASSPEEFFAVCSEYHFTAPDLLADELPTVARHLERLYGRSPMPSRLD